MSGYQVIVQSEGGVIWWTALVAAGESVVTHPILAQAEEAGSRMVWEDDRLLVMVPDDFVFIG